MFERNYVPLFGLLIGQALHFYLCKLLVWDWNWSTYGIGVATSAANTANLVSVLTYTSFIEELQEALFMPTFDSFEGIKEYFYLGSASVMMLCCEWWAFEVVILFAGSLGVSQQAALIVIYNLTFFFFNAF